MIYSTARPTLLKKTAIVGLTACEYFLPKPTGGAHKGWGAGDTQVVKAVDCSVKRNFVFEV